MPIDTRCSPWASPSRPLAGLQSHARGHGRRQLGEGCRLHPCVLSPDRTDHGIWLLKDGKAELVHIDICAPVMHGKNGEDGTIQGLFELARIPT